MKVNTCNQAATLWLNYQDGIKNYLLKSVDDRDLANDFAQEVFLKVCKSCCSGREIKNVRSWLFQISHHIMIDYFKKQPHLTAEFHSVADQSERSVWQEIEAYVEPLVQLLPEKYAVPLRLADLENKPQAVVARRLGLSLSATKSRVQRARELLKQEILTCMILETDVQGNLIAFSVKESCKPLRAYQEKNL